MSGDMISAALLRALRHLSPDVLLAVMCERPWHSRAMTGTQLCLSAVFIGKDHRTVAAEFARTLPDYEFKLGSEFVADIAVIAHTADDAETRLVVEALVLED